MNLQSCLTVSSLLFVIGVYGLLTRRNLIAVLVSLELLINAALINFIAMARFSSNDPHAGSIFSLFIIATTAGEVALALGIVMAIYRRKRLLDIRELKGLRG